MSLQEFIAQDAVLFCLDLEAHCRNQDLKDFQAGIRSTKRRIIEIGLTVLDTRDIGDKVLGDRGINIALAFQASQFKIKDHFHDPARMKGHPKWCRQGNGDGFLFGKQKYIKKRQIRSTLVAQIRKFVELPSQASRQKGPRKAIFLTFGGTQDYIWLAEAGVNLAAEFPNSDFRDIQHSLASRAIGRHLRKQNDICKSEEFLGGMGITTSGLHTGGNDSMFELQAYMAALTMTSEQVTELRGSGQVRPMLPGLWEVLKNPDQLEVLMAKQKEQSPDLQPTWMRPGDLKDVIEAMATLEVDEESEWEL